METNQVKKIHDLGQSIWMDSISRQMINSGELEKLIEEDGVKGITSNPTIFEKAIGGSADYDKDIRRLAEEGKSDEEIFYSLAVSDIRRAADLLKPVWQEDGDSMDGYVSLEVSPHLARNTEGSIRQARALWKAVDRKNVMIKIPGTAEGLPAIRQCTSEGININITLLFGLERYEEVTDAYLSGLEDRLKAGQPVDHIASVASFFLSRIDVMIDPLLKEKGVEQLKGEVAIASAKKAYGIYKRVFNSERFKKLAAKGAKPQWVLWASTSSKDPAFSDTKYVEALIGPQTVNTIPMNTLEAYQDHGEPKSRLEDDPGKADQVLERLKQAGIRIDDITQRLENEGIEKFNKSYDDLLEAIDGKKKKTLAAQ